MAHDPHPPFTTLTSNRDRLPNLFRPGARFEPGHRSPVRPFAPALVAAVTESRGDDNDPPATVKRYSPEMAVSPGKVGTSACPGAKLEGPPGRRQTAPTRAPLGVGGAAQAGHAKTGAYGAISDPGPGLGSGARAGPR
ncbi:hypothetical protein FTUN_5518 [Frigoriglobus tundricola]|uniref:Uncharacterized protein n=1 Tax=Frigoriglobus tundricola TaxID=2774151 RepID=A0A6M5YVG8_9BACT|nr:hypothetical protein FTUN_5518 [Frigoriglobus tundricola]